MIFRFIPWDIIGTEVGHHLWIAPSIRVEECPLERNIDEISFSVFLQRGRHPLRFLENILRHGLIIAYTT